MRYINPSIPPRSPTTNLRILAYIYGREPPRFGAKEVSRNQVGLKCVNTTSHTIC